MDLAKFRELRGLTQDQAAAELGLKSRTTIWKIESGKPAPPRLALKIEQWSDGVVRADSISPVVAELRAA